MAAKGNKGMSSTLARARTGGARRGGGVVEAMKSRAAAVAETRMVPVGDIQPNPDNPVERSKPGEGLVASIREVGVIQDLVLVPVEQWSATHPEQVDALTDAPYVVLAGHRRLAAAVAAERDEVPARVRDDLDATTLDSLVVHENIHREALTPVEEAHAYRRILERQGLSQRALAKHTGVSQSQISKKLRLLDLPVGVQEAVSAGMVGVEEAGLVLGEEGAVAEIVGEALTAAEERVDLPTLIEDARHSVRVQELQERARSEAEDRGAPFVPLEGLTEHLKVGNDGGTWRHLLRDPQDVERAQQAGSLVVSHSAVSRWGGEPRVEFYSTEAPAPVETRQTTTRKDSDHHRIKANRARRAALPDMTSTAPPIDTIRQGLLGWAMEGHGWGADVYKVAQPLLADAGLIPEDTDSWTVPAALASLPEKKQYHAAWILLIARREVTVGMPDHGGRGWGPTHVEHYGWMTDHGYEPSEWEREQLHAAQDETTTSKENTDD